MLAIFDRGAFLGSVFGTLLSFLIPTSRSKIAKVATLRPPTTDDLLLRGQRSRN